MRKLVLLAFIAISSISHSFAVNIDRTTPTALYINFYDDGNGIDDKTFKKFKQIEEQYAEHIVSITSNPSDKTSAQNFCIKFKDSEYYSRAITRLATSINKNSTNKTELYSSKDCGDISLATLQDVDAYKQSAVLIHGAHFTAKSFMFVQDELTKLGIQSHALDLLGRDGDPKVSLYIAALDLCAQLIRYNDKKLIIAHSQAGAVVNQAILYCPQEIKEVVYLAAVMPKCGEKAYEKLEQHDKDSYTSTVYLENGTFYINDTDTKTFLDVFANDVPYGRKRNFVLFNAVPEGALVGEGVSTTPNYYIIKLVDKYYIKTNLDKVISPFTQDKYIKSLNINKVYSLDTGHLPMISAPDKLADIIDELM